MTHHKNGNRILASFFAGALAFMAALDAGLPVWRDLPIGDATDFGVTGALFVWYALGSLRPRAA
jgi:hypothetical protein